MRPVLTKNNGNRFTEQYEWTVGVFITVQIGERGTFTDVQIDECGKQRVNCYVNEIWWQTNYKINVKFSLNMEVAIFFSRKCKLFI